MAKKGAPDERNQGGRPSEFKPKYILQTTKLCRQGATDEELAALFDKSTTTIDNWKKQHPEFLGALKERKLTSDMEVADRLHQRAMGLEYMEAQAHKLKAVEYKDGKRVERLDTIMVKRVVPPDMTACIFWLKNHRKVEWRERQEAPQKGR